MVDIKDNAGNVLFTGTPEECAEFIKQSNANNIMTSVKIVDIIFLSVFAIIILYMLLA